MFGFRGAAMLDSRKRDEVEVNLNLCFTACEYRMKFPSLGRRKVRKFVRIEDVKTKSRGWAVGWFGVEIRGNSVEGRAMTLSSRRQSRSIITGVTA